MMNSAGFQKSFRGLRSMASTSPEAKSETFQLICIKEVESRFLQCLLEIAGA